MGAGRPAPPHPFQAAPTPTRTRNSSSLLSETVSCDRDHGQMSFSLNFHEMGSPTDVSLPRSGAGAVTWLAVIALSGFVFGGGGSNMAEASSVSASAISAQVDCARIQATRSNAGGACCRSWDWLHLNH